MAECEHKFDGSRCMRCGVRIEDKQGDQRSSRTAAPRELSDGAEMWRTTLERALTAARRRDTEARNLISVLQQHASDDHLRARIRAWLDGDEPAPQQIGGAQLSGAGRSERLCCGKVL